MDIKKAKKDLAIMFFFLFFCICLFVYIIPHQIPVTSAAQKQTFTPRTFPYLLAGGLLVCSIIGSIQALINYLKIKKMLVKSEIIHEETNKRKEILSFLIPYISYVIILIYGMFFKKFGFIIATLIMPPILLILLKDHKWYHYLIFYMFAAFMFIIFKIVLKVPLP